MNKNEELLKALEDKKSFRERLQKGENAKKVAKELNVELVLPLLCFDLD